MTEFSFTLHKTDGAARLGTVRTLHGDIRTPTFMPVGTVGTVKGLYLDQVKETGADIILGNTYHLMLRPGAEEVAKLGGLHNFIGWDGPILTDSGGFSMLHCACLVGNTQIAMMLLQYGADVLALTDVRRRDAGQSTGCNSSESDAPLCCVVLCCLGDCWCFFVGWLHGTGPGDLERPLADH